MLKSTAAVPLSTIFAVPIRFLAGSVHPLSDVNMCLVMVSFQPSLEKDGKGVILDQPLVDFYDQHSEPRSSRIDGKWHRWPRYVKTRRKEINLKVPQSL